MPNPHRPGQHQNRRAVIGPGSHQREACRAPENQQRPQRKVRNATTPPTTNAARPRARPTLTSGRAGAPPVAGASWRHGTFTAGASRTRTSRSDVVARPGNTPCRPAPDQVTVHCTVAVNRYTPPGRAEDACWYVCPQVGDTAPGLTDAEYTDPGPAQTTVLPSPSDHTTRTGEAVAVTDTPGTDADADRRPHEPPDTASQVGRYTN